MSPRLLLTIFCSALAASVWAADPPSSTPNTDLDKAAVEVLKDLHNRGADLYNAADAVGAMRLYEATLRAIGPFLAHRPKLQATIADGLAEVGKLDGPKAQAYRLHEVIDQVRNDLRTAMKADAEAKPPEKEDPKAGKKDDPKPGDQKTEPKPGEPAPEPKPADKKVDPKPGEKKSEEKPVPPAIGSLNGTLTLDGVSVPKATVTLVSLTLSKQQTFTAETDPDGRFAFPAELPATNYAVIVASGEQPIPAKFQSAKTSGVELVIKAGEQVFDVKLQSK